MAASELECLQRLRKSPPTPSPLCPHQSTCHFHSWSQLKAGMLLADVLMPRRGLEAAKAPSGGQKGAGHAQHGRAKDVASEPDDHPRGCLTQRKRNRICCDCTRPIGRKRYIFGHWHTDLTWKKRPSNILFPSSAVPRSLSDAFVMVPWYHSPVLPGELVNTFSKVVP